MTSQRIVIFFHSDHSVSWVKLTETGDIQQSAYRQEINTLSLPPMNHDVYVIVPAQTILLTEVQLPKLNRARLRQALPFALEEQLVEEVDHLHFAMGDYQADGSIPVAIINRLQLESWLGRLKDAGLSPVAILPALFALPYSEEYWHVTAYDSMGLVRIGKYSGFACDPENISTLLELKKAESIDPKEIIQIKRDEPSLLTEFAKNIFLYPSINLLQGPYQPKHTNKKAKKTWLTAFYLTIAWIGFAFFSKIMSCFILSAQNYHLNLEIAKIYRVHFPTAKSVIAPRERMEEKLRKLSFSNNENPFLSLLALLSNSFASRKEIQLHRLDFRNSQITLDISASSFNSIDALIQLLTQQGLTIKQQNAASVNSEAKATLLITAGIS